MQCNVLRQFHSACFSHKRRWRHSGRRKASVRCLSFPYFYDANARAPTDSRSALGVWQSSSLPTTNAASVRFGLSVRGPIRLFDQATPLAVAVAYLEFSAPGGAKRRSAPPPEIFFSGGRGLKVYKYACIGITNA